MTPLASRLLLLSALTLSCAANLSAQTAQTPPVPAPYQDLYSMMDAKIADFESKIRAEPAVTADSSVDFGGELLTANAHRGTQLLAPRTNAGVILELDRLQALGLKSVTVAVSFPMLYRPFLEWNGDPGDFQHFLDFYKGLAADVHSRGMKLVIESGTLFPGVYSSSSGFKLADYYQTLNNRQYIAGRAQVATTIAREIRPDYLVIGSEPDTEAKLTGKPFLNTPNGFAVMIAKMVTNLHANKVRDIPIGAGVGTWKQDGEAYIRAMVTAAPGLEFIDLHVYPVNLDFLDNLIHFTNVAQSLGKKVAICEAWLQKQRDSEFRTLDAAFNQTVYSRDTFSFWAPLDQRFLRAMVDFARAKNLLLLSPYWTKFFHSYLEYSEIKSLTPAQIVARSNAAAAAAMMKNQFSETGLVYQRAIFGEPKP